VRDQLSLFPPTEPVRGEELPGRARDLELSRELPENLRFGTSSWTFPGWAGIVYRGQPSERTLAQGGLAEYADHPLFRTVGIDSAYYRPLTEATLERYRQQLPRGYQCVVKAWNEITSLRLPRVDSLNPRFLDAALCEHEVLRPLATFADNLGPLVFEFAPMRGLSVEVFAPRLDEFLAGLSRDFRYAVELRNVHLFGPRYLEVLHRHGVAHVLNFWERMPSLGEQLEVDGVLSAEHVVARLLIPPKKRYAERKRELSPFNQIVDPQPEMRDDVVALCDRVTALKKVLFVIVNNKAEGSSPLTVRALIEHWLRTRRELGSTAPSHA